MSERHSSVIDSDNNGDKKYKRIRVRRQKGEDGKYLPHQHQHSSKQSELKETENEDVPIVMKKTGHRIMRKHDGKIEKSYAGNSSSFAEEVQPVSISGLTNIDEKSEIHSGSFKEESRISKKKVEHSRLEYGRIKRASQLTKHRHKDDDDNDRTFTQLPEEVSINQKKVSSRFQKAYFSESDPDIESEDSETITESVEPVSYSESFEPELVEKDPYVPPELISRGIQPNPEDVWNPQEEEKLRSMVAQIRPYLYPRKYRPNGLINSMFNSDIPVLITPNGIMNQSKPELKIESSSTASLPVISSASIKEEKNTKPKEPTIESQDQLISVSELVTANTEDGEFVLVSDENPNGIKYIEISGVQDTEVTDVVAEEEEIEEEEEEIIEEEEEDNGEEETAEEDME